MDLITNLYMPTNYWKEYVLKIKKSCQMRLADIWEDARDSASNL